MHVHINISQGFVENKVPFGKCFICLHDDLVCVCVFALMCMYVFASASDCV